MEHTPPGEVSPPGGNLQIVNLRMLVNSFEFHTAPMRYEIARALPYMLALD